MGQRATHHKNIINAARATGVEFIAYTSLINAGSGGMKLAAEHLATEEELAASGIPFVVLRNGWYMEIFTEQLAGYLERGVVLGTAGEGRFSAATRRDLAEAAVVVLLEGTHAGGPGC